jgi:ribosomal protein S27E
MAETLPTVTCSFCGNELVVDPEKLGAATHVIYRSPTVREESYTVRCERCGKHTVVTLRVTED